MKLPSTIIYATLLGWLLGNTACQSKQADEFSFKPISSFEELQEEAISLPSTEKSVPLSIPNVVDFRVPAKKVIPGVVHIISTYEEKIVPKGQMEIPEFFRDFFGDDYRFHFERPQLPNLPRMGNGSGVIISAKGHILTNHHVIKDATKIEIITHDNRSYIATVIGKDPTTDLALLKMEANQLPYVKMGDSDKIEIGEWVLAVGNPFNLSTTVTAGIVSAKARSINIIPDRASIESFIQTDAAVNPGNSGGALVNLQGELIGINTAIASPTGAYAGYSFAIPINIAEKVADDLLNFGEVHRAYLGVYIRNLDGELAQQLKLESTNGIYLDSVIVGSAAHQAGVRAEDVITKIDGEAINESPRFQEVIGRHRPDDKLTLTIIRKGKERQVIVKLKGKTKESIAQQPRTFEVLGIDVMDLSVSDRNQLQVRGGVEVTKIYDGKILELTNIRPGFIITTVNGQIVLSVSDFLNKVSSGKGILIIEGFYREHPNIMYSYSFPK